MATLATWEGELKKKTILATLVTLERELKKKQWPHLLHGRENRKKTMATLGELECPC